MSDKTTELICDRRTLRPKFIYCYSPRTLYWTNLLTGELSCNRAPYFRFNECCCWSELPGGSLLITGGGDSRDAVMIETLREFAVCFQPPMHTARCSHAAVYHSQYLYVLAGFGGRCLRECERYVCAESRWEVLPALPVAGAAMSAVELDRSLYALGGNAEAGYLDTVQRLSLDSLTWGLMQLKLPEACSSFPCFKTDTQVYMVIEKTLYSFSPLQVKPVKTVPNVIRCDVSCYSRGTLYFAWTGEIKSLAVGELA
jgi:hypothetical protein